MFQNTTCVLNIQVTILFNSRNRHSKHFITANSSVPVIVLPVCNKLTLQGASAAVGLAICHIPTVLQATIMHLLKEANVFTGTTLRLDIYLLLRLVKTSNKSECKSITHHTHSDNNLCQRASSSANNRERQKHVIKIQRSVIRFKTNILRK